MNYKKDFPIFDNNKWLVFLDSAASSQKPSYVIDAVCEFVGSDYANIHRWNYKLSERASDMYYKSKVAVSKFLNCDAGEVIYWYNSTHCFNLIAGALCNSWKLWKWDKVLLWIREHHSNILPWMSLQKIFWFEIEFVWIDKNTFEIDRDDFDKKYDEKVKVVSINHVSNVTGQIYDVKQIKSKLKDDTFFVVDISQSMPSLEIDFVDIWADALIFTWHKLMSYTWIWGMCLKQKWIKELNPISLWGWTIKDVSTCDYKLSNSNEKWEAGTPNFIWAVSLLKAIEYIENIWGVKEIYKHEMELGNYFLQEIQDNDLENFKLIWSKNMENRLPVFSFLLENNSNFNEIGEVFDENNIAIRCGGHCAYPLHKDLKVGGTCRASFYLYNTKEDVDKFFEVLKSLEW